MPMGRTVELYVVRYPRGVLHQIMDQVESDRALESSAGACWFEISKGSNTQGAIGHGSQRMIKGKSRAWHCG